MSTDHQQFVQAVQDQGGLADPSRTEACVATVLECLGRRLNGGTARALAEHLPEREASLLTLHADPDEGTPGDASDLAEDIAAKAGIDPIDARNVLQATVRTIVDAVGDRERLDRVRDQLPPDLAALFGSTDEAGGRFRSTWTPGSGTQDR